MIGKKVSVTECDKCGIMKSNKKKKKRAKQKTTTSLSKFGVTTTKKELMALEWDWLHRFNSKMEKGYQLTLQNVLSTFPLNTLYYKTPAGSQTLFTNHNKKPSYTNSNLALIKILFEGGFQFVPKETKPNSAPSSGQAPKKTSAGYGMYMETIIMKDVKAELLNRKKLARQERIQEFTVFKLGELSESRRIKAMETLMRKLDLSGCEGVENWI